MSGSTDALDLEDDVIGQGGVILTAKQMVVLAAQTENKVAKGVGYKAETPWLTDGDASYKVYFGLIPGPKTVAPRPARHQRRAW